jgi:hypothetical protein
MIVSYRPSEDRRAHLEGFAALKKGHPHLVDLRVGKHHTHALPQTTLSVVVVDKLRNHLAQDDEFVVHMPKSSIELLCDLDWICLARLEGLIDTRFDRPNYACQIEECCGQGKKSAYWFLG